MPKNKGKKTDEPYAHRRSLKPLGPRRTTKADPNEQYSDDDGEFDNASVYSSQSETYHAENGEREDSGSDNSIEKFEEKLMQAIENSSDKSLQTRINAFQAINEILVHHHMSEFIEDRKVTILDAVEKSIRRGKGLEQAWAAKLIPLIIIQLEGVDEIQEMMKTLKQILLVVAQDNSAQFDARAKCCTSLGLLYFLSDDDIGDLLVLMKNFENIFSGSYLKGDNSPSAATADAGTLHSAALHAWGLLLTLIPPGDFVSFMNNQSMLPSIKNLAGLLQSPHLEVRMAAGEAIALILECGRQHDEDFLEDDLTDLIQATQKLATDAHKYRAKKDRKVQRATFRDVLRFLEEDESPEISVKFGHETLDIDTWALHHQYTTLLKVLGSGMCVHIANNDFVRQILQMGDRQADETRSKAVAKAEKKFINAAAFKARTITRGKNRDKRSAVVN